MRRVALKASSARLDPLDAVNVIANRGAGDRFFHVASAYRCAMSVWYRRQAAAAFLIRQRLQAHPYALHNL